MKKLILILCIALLPQCIAKAQTTIALNNNQSMCITGKGQGQDGAINPYIDKAHSYAIVENVGKNAFSIRIQKQGKIIKEIAIKPRETKTVKLLKGEELYFDSEKKTKVKIDFKGDTN